VISIGESLLSLAALYLQLALNCDEALFSGLGLSLEPLNFSLFLLNFIDRLLELCCMLRGNRLPLLLYLPLYLLERGAHQLIVLLEKIVLGCQLLALGLQSLQGFVFLGGKLLLNSNDLVLVACRERLHECLIVL